MNKRCEIIYSMGTGDDIELYFAQKGYRNDVSVKIGHCTYEVYFFLPSNLIYEMTLDGYCSFPGLIILDDITSANIENSIHKLIELGYFNYLNPVAEGAKRFWDKVIYTP
jgi:hypothetical protein